MGMCPDGNCPECVSAREEESSLIQTLRPDLTPEQRAEIGKVPESLRDWHDAFRRRARMVRVRRSAGTVRNPDTGGPKGKAAIKAAKRERVKAMKAATA